MSTFEFAWIIAGAIWPVLLISVLAVILLIIDLVKHRKKRVYKLYPDQRDFIKIYLLLVIGSVMFVGLVALVFVGGS